MNDLLIRKAMSRNGPRVKVEVAVNQGRTNSILIVFRFHRKPAAVIAPGKLIG